TVLDENGLPLSFDGQGTDTICVQWGDGPFGTIMLDVSDCDDAYCDKPTSVVVPIIPQTVDISGLTEVCEFETATYTVPKWISVYYDWQVSGGTVVSGQGTNTVEIQWGSAGVGLITLNYYSDFLGGLPGHDDPDCYGTANLSVLIQPQFQIFDPFPNPTCVNSTSNIFATAFPSGNYTWTISPPATFSGQGTNNINVTWDNGPGVFEVSAIPDDPSVYCNDMASIFVTVVEVQAPDGIDGPTDICPGETYTYFGLSNEPGTGLIWTITGGDITTFTGNPLTVTWNNSGPYGLALQQFQLNPPFCTSDPFVLPINPKTINGPLVITGTDACINDVSSYSGGPVQHPDASYNWSISPGTLGSIISGQGTPNVQIQWNNDPGTANLTFSVELCGNTVSETLPVQLTGPTAPVITQIGDLCPGQSATLDGGPGYGGYQWSTGSNSQTTVITSGGTYVLTVTDANGCQTISSYQAVELPGPIAQISTPDVLKLCIIPPNSSTVTISVQTQAGYTFQWYCNGSLQVLPPGQATFVHTNTNVIGTFNYWVVVTDANGCTETSNTITVIQTDDCTGGGDGCNIPTGAYSLSFTALNQSPACNVVDFTVSASPNVVLNNWNFGDPFDNTNTGSLANAVHTYTQAGYYMASLGATVFHPLDTCVVGETQSVCIPLAADFIFNENCLAVSFTDLSTYLPGHDANAWQWDFGDFNTSTSQHPVHTYSSPGTYTVTLIVGNANGCKAVISQTVVVTGLPVPVLTAIPNPVCVGETVSFTGSAPGIISWLWDFGDGSTNGDQNPDHSYTSPGTYNVTLNVINQDGCTGSDSLSVVVHPGIPEDTIAYSPSLTICEGESVTLSAPPGYAYQWSSGPITQSISVSTAGDYDVTLTDVNNCSRVLGPVTVVVLPKPDAAISGNLFICDNGCVTLSATPGFGYTYQWLDHTSSPIPFQTGQTITVCDFNLLAGYAVSITDANGCSDVSDPVSVAVATSPSFGIIVAPDPCEGMSSTLTISPVQPDVVYSWNTGESGTSISVIPAGTYTAIGTDTLTGCSSSASAIIHPLPDLCLVPVGCYEVCNPDTICGPPGLAAYQWNMNGLPIAGETGECLIVTQSGSYSLTGVTEFGCTDTSDVLILEIVDCECEALEIASTDLDSCCWSLSLSNNFAEDLYGLMIHTGDADLNFNLGGLDPSLSVYTIGDNWLGLVNSTPSDPFPTGNLSDFVEVCLSDVINSPVEITFDWYDFDLEIVCSDSLEFECPVEPDCLYMVSDSIYCENGQVIYDFVVCNPVDNDFDVGFIQIVPFTPPGVVISPPDFDLSGNPILAGACDSFSVVLTGPNIAGQLFCYQLIAHEFNPMEVDTALCCSIQTEYCIEIPDCDPCDDIGIEEAERGEDCCFTISLFNNYDPAYFDGIGLCLIDAGSTMTINNPFGSGWITSAYGPQFIDLNVSPPLGNFIPIGSFQLPEICIENEGAPNQRLEIKWMVGDEIVCRDTVALFCEPDCGYFFNEEIVCNADGTWT
ncbi:MAG: PKD domain-containing protein, partial [Bacteroidetes bacterium]